MIVLGEAGNRSAAAGAIAERAAYRGAGKGVNASNILSSARIPKENARYTHPALQAPRRSAGEEAGRIYGLETSSKGRRFKAAADAPP